MATPNPSIPATRVNRLRAADSQGVISIDDKLEFHDDNDRQDFLDHLAAPLGPVSDVLDAYFSAVTTITDDQFDRIQAFIDEINYAGLSANLIDACFLRAGQNTGSNAPKTLKLATGAATSIAWGPEGISFTGSSYVTFPVTQAANASWSLVVDQRWSADGVPSAATPFGLENTGGTASMQKIHCAALGMAHVYGKQGAAAATTTTAIGLATDFTGISNYNRQQQIVGFTYKDQTTPQVLVYVDGVLALDTVATTTRSTSALNQLTLGGLTSSTDTFRGEIASWALFNRVLTAAEHRTVMRALRHLDSKPINIVVLGDSVSAQIATSGGDINWPYQMSRMSRFSGQARIINHSVATSAVALDALVATHVELHKPNDTVRETILILFAGTDGLNVDGTSYITELGALQSIMRKAAAVGITVYLVNLPKYRVAGTWNAGNESARVNLNSSLVGGKQLHEALIDAEKLFGTTATTATATYWTDEIHLNAQGHLELAGLINSGRAAAALGDSPSAVIWVNASASAGGDGSMSKPFNSLASAVADADPGDVISLLPGSYSLASDLTLSEAIEICGSGRSITTISCPSATKITIDTPNILISDLRIVRSGSNAGAVLTCNVTGMTTIKDGIAMRNVEVVNASGIACGTWHGDAYNCRFYGMTAIDYLYGGRLHNPEVEAHDPTLAATTYGIKTAQSISGAGGEIAYSSTESDKRRKSLVSGGRIINTDQNGVCINGVTESPTGDRTTHDWHFNGAVGAPTVSWYPVPLMGVYILGPQPRAGSGTYNNGVLTRTPGTGGAVRGTLRILNCEIYGFYQASYLHDSDIVGGVWVSESGTHQVMKEVINCSFVGTSFIYGNNRLGTVDGLRRVSLNTGNHFNQCHFQGETDSVFEGYQALLTNCSEFGFDAIHGTVGYNQQRQLALRMNGNSGCTLLTASTSAYSLTTCTFELWFRCNNTGSDQALFSYEDPGVGAGAISAAIKPSTGQIYIWAGGNFVINSSPFTFANSAWHHLALTFNAGTGVVFLDGTQIGTQSSLTMGTGPSTFRMGHSNGGGNRFRGDIAEFRISNTRRYTGAFTPTRNWIPDSATLSLWTDSSRKVLGWTDKAGLLDLTFTQGVGGAPDIPFWVPRDRSYTPN